MLEKKILRKVLFEESGLQLSSMKFHFDEKEVHDIGAITTNFLKEVRYFYWNSIQRDAIYSEENMRVISLKMYKWGFKHLV